MRQMRLLAGDFRIEISDQKYDQMQTVPSSLNLRPQTRFKTNNQSTLAGSEGSSGKGWGKNTN